MIEQEVVDYILQAQKHGLSDFEIKQNLINVGWEAATVEDSLVFAKASENKTALNPQPTKNFNLSPLPLQGGHQPTVFQNPAHMPSASAVEAVHTQPFHAAANLEPSLTPKAAPLKGGTFYKKPLFWTVIAALLVLGGGGAYAYLGFFSATPAKVINKFLTAPKAKTFNTTYSFSYTDSSAASSTGNIGLSFSGNLSSDFSDPNNIKQQNNINASLTYGVANFGVNFKYLLLGQVIYFDIGQIPQLKAFLPGQNIEWVKVDLNELKKQQDQSESQIFNQMSLSPQTQNKLKAIWTKADVIKTTNFLAKESLNGIPTYHLKEQFDNQAFSQALINSIQDIASSSTSTNASLTDSDKQLITALVNKVQVKEFDLWIGQKDSEIYKFHLLVSAPGAKDFSNPIFMDSYPGLNQAQAKGRDAKRFADVNQIQSALELFHNDYGGYPAGGNKGAPGGNITPAYIKAWPAAPLPLDGSCTNYYNTYWYTPEGKASVKNGQTVYPSYQLTFCLGEPTGLYNAGIGMLTPSGIQSDIACPTTADKCVNNSMPADNSAKILSAVNQMGFGAQLQIDAGYSDYGKPQSIIAPAASTDILDLIKGVAGQALNTTTTPLQQ